MIESDELDPIMALELLSKLKQKGFIKEAVVLNPNCNDLRDKYLLDFPKIVAALKNTSYSGSSFYNFWNYLIGMSDKKINKSSLFGILPSREHFWEELCSVKLLTDVKRFVIFEIEVLKKVLEEKKLDMKLKLLNNISGMNCKMVEFNDVPWVNSEGVIVNEPKGKIYFISRKHLGRDSTSGQPASKFFVCSVCF